MIVDDYSRRFAELLFDLHPEWRQYVKPAKDWRGTEILLVEVPTPNARAMRGLSILTEGESAIVGFDAWHRHFEQTIEQAFDSASGLIADLLSEKMVAVSYWSDDVMGLAFGSDLSEPLPDPEPGQRRLVRSWYGNKDSDVFATPHS